MGSGDEDSGEDAVGKAMRAASLARTEAKKTEHAAAEALDLARKEMKRKEKLIEMRKAKTAKKTMRSYFQSTRGACGGQLLSLVFDGSLPEVLGAEPNFGEDVDVMAGSSSSSRDMRVLGSKSPLITISSELENMDNTDLREVPDDSEDLEDDFVFENPPPLKKGVTTRRKAQSSKSKQQKRYDRHKKFQTVGVAKLPWAEGIMASDGILQMVKCKVCSAFERKPCVMAPKSDTFFKHDGKRIAKKNMPQFKVKKREQYVTTRCRHRKNC